MKPFIVIALAALLTGCMGSMGYQGMSAEQIKALGKEANVSCTDITGMWGRGRNVFVNVDKSVVDKGGIEVTADCAVKFLNERQFVPHQLTDPKLPALPALEWVK